MENITSLNPATLEILGTVPNMDAKQVEEAVRAARAVQTAWASLGFAGRRKLMLRLKDVILSEMDGIVDLITRETGKPRIEAFGGEVLSAMDMIVYVAKKAERVLKKETLKLGRWNLLGHKSYLEYYPLGVVGIIAPWNFPFSISLGEIVMALMVGNTVVYKPSEYSPLVGVKIKELLAKARFPQDVFRMVTGDGKTGAALVKSGVNKIAFTGSVRTGKAIMATCAETLTPVTLELGGKDPLIVFSDADLDVASSAAVWGAFCNSGQVCASVERVYVQKDVAQKFTGLVVDKVKKLRQGNGMSNDVEIGAMTNEMQLKLVHDHVEDAKKRGARILTGGERNADLKGYFYRPTVLDGVDHSFRIVAEESFGPILPIMTFQSEDEVVNLANDSAYALDAYIWTKDVKRGERVASRIVAGTVNVNDSLFSHAIPQTPWGGPKNSGLGRTHGAMGLMDLVDVRHVHVNSAKRKKDYFWWYGYSGDKIQLYRLMAEMFFGNGFFHRVKYFLKFAAKLGRVRVD